jgi:hypothetical protein
MMTLFARVALLALLPILLTGCIEINARSELLPDGSARTHTEIAIEKTAVAQLMQMQAEMKAASAKSSRKDKSPVYTFSSLCRSGIEDLVTQEPPGQSTSKSKSKPKASAAAEVKPPKIIGTPSERGAFQVCTLTETYTDPMPQYQAAMKRSGLSPEMATMELLPGGNGYRYGGKIRLADVVAADKAKSGPTAKTDTANEKMALAMLTALMPRDAAMTISVTGVRVENTNGVVSPDGTSVTWKVPFLKVLDLSPDAEPLELKADVYFK